MLLLDDEIYKGIVKISTHILKNNFFYDNDCLARFLNIFSEYMQEEYEFFTETAHEDFKRDLKKDLELKKEFTSYFVSSHLHSVLVNELYFSDYELYAFENILPVYIGAKNDAKQGNKRAHN